MPNECHLKTSKSIRNLHRFLRQHLLRLNRLLRWHGISDPWATLRSTRIYIEETHMPRIDPRLDASRHWFPPRLPPSRVIRLIPLFLRSFGERQGERRAKITGAKEKAIKWSQPSILTRVCDWRLRSFWSGLLITKTANSEEEHHFSTHPQLPYFLPASSKCGPYIKYTLVKFSPSFNYFSESVVFIYFLHSKYFSPKNLYN